MKRDVHPLDREALRRQFRDARPFPFIAVDDFLDPDFAREVASAYTGYSDARALGREFSAVNERRKLQMTATGGPKS